MARPAYIVLSKWPYDELTVGGKVTSLFSSYSHIGILLPNCTAREIQDHSNPGVSHESARGAKHVCFDFVDKRSRFQSYTNKRYYTPGSTVLVYPILGVDCSAIHRACLEAAHMDPYNFFLYRLNSLVWCTPVSFFSSSGPMAPSTCVALTLRIIASARGNELAFYSDRETQLELGLKTFGSSNFWSPALLNGHTPLSALEAMQLAHVVGPLTGDFEDAIGMCVKTGRCALTRGEVGPLLVLKL